MVETIFDTLNAKAALFAVDVVFERRGYAIPVMLSGSIVDASRRTLSGQTGEAFWVSVGHSHPQAVGLPNAMGGNDETGPQFAENACDFTTGGLINLIGGCCGTTPDHIAAVAAIVKDCKPCPIPTILNCMCICGLELFEYDPSSPSRRWWTRWRAWRASSS